MTMIDKQGNKIQQIKYLQTKTTDSSDIKPKRLVSQQARLDQNVYGDIKQVVKTKQINNQSVPRAVASHPQTTKVNLGVV